MGAIGLQPSSEGGMVWEHLSETLFSRRAAPDPTLPAVRRNIWADPAVRTSIKEINGRGIAALCAKI